MYQFKGMEDTIAAIATAQGQGGIGIVRLSGREALRIADEIVRTRSGRLLSTCKSFSVHYGWVVDRTQQPEDVIDEVLVSIFRQPKSYTAEDVVELSCHGGALSVRAVLTLVLEHGARLAEPGEFTKRAFINGRIDLTQAEAVLDIIQAKTDAFLRVSTHQLKGELSVEVDSIRDGLMSCYTEIEAIVNFPEDEIDARGRDELIAKIEIQEQRVAALVRSSENGRILKEGIRIVLCGRPNVGKSSLLNALLKQPRAIVTDIAGTTRDVLEESAQINGVPLQLVDTAGILEPRDLIEEEAVKRSHLYIESADLVLLILDASQALTEQDRMLMDKLIDRKALVVLNKSDLPAIITNHDLIQAFPEKKSVQVSTLNKSGIDQLEQAIVAEVLGNVPVEMNGLMVSNFRQSQSLKIAQASCVRAINLAREGISWEFVSEEIKFAVNGLDNVTGRNIDADLLDRIFSEFCIGK